MTNADIEPSATLTGVISMGDPDVKFEKFVQAGRDVVSRTGWLLGVLAIQVENLNMGEEKVAEFARRIEIPYSTLVNARTVARAWGGLDETWHPKISFGVAKVLAAQEDRFQIAGAKPDMTVREATILVRERRGALPAPAVQDEGEFSDKALRIVQRTINQQVSLVPDDHAAQVADLLDRAANRLRKRAKEIESGEDQKASA